MEKFLGEIFVSVSQSYNNVNKVTEEQMNSALLALIIIGCVVLFLLGVFIVYLIILLRRSNIVAKKIDYLVEDVTYKAESLNIFVEAVNKTSGYLLAFDVISKRSLNSLLKILRENKNYFYYFFDKMKEQSKNNDLKNKDNVDIDDTKNETKNKENKENKSSAKTKTSSTKSKNINNSSKQSDKDSKDIEK